MSNQPSLSKLLLLGGSGLLALKIVQSEIESQQEQTMVDFRKEDSYYLAHEVIESREPSSGKRHAVVFLHGWPDDVALFRQFATQLALKSKYMCVNCNLPGYPVPEMFKGDTGKLPNRKWGFTLEEASLLLGNTIKKTCSAQDIESVTLVTHDWGAVCGYLLVDDEVKRHGGDSSKLILQRVISLDVGSRVNGTHAVGMLGYGIYQGLLNIFFLLPSSIGGKLTEIEASLLGRKSAPGAGKVTNSMNWPYRSCWRDLIVNGPARRFMNYRPPKLPSLFLYGNTMPEMFQFCDEGWAHSVRETLPPVSRVERMPGGHWFMNHNPYSTLAVLEKWLAESEQYMQPRARL